MEIPRNKSECEALLFGSTENSLKRDLDPDERRAFHLDGGPSPTAVSGRDDRELFGP